MVLIAIEEFIDANPWHGLRFGTLEPVEEGSIKQYPVQNNLYDVTVSDHGLEVVRDGKMLFVTDSPVEIRHVQFRDGAVTAEVRSKRSGSIHIGGQSAQPFSEGLTKISGRV
jgi:hypothetical protein